MSIVYSPSIAMRSYLSSQFLWSAKRFARVSEELETERASERAAFDIEHRAYVMASVMTSVAFLEAAINELFQDAADRHHGHDGDVLAPLSEGAIRRMKEWWTSGELKFENFSILDKYQALLVIAELSPLPKGGEPFQSAQKVIRLRNELMHFKPMTQGYEDLHKIAEVVRGEFTSNQLMAGAGNPAFPDHVLGAGCAAWAWRSCVAFAEGVFDEANLYPNYRQVDFAPPP